jgi:FkbM family methyltransferase
MAPSAIKTIVSNKLHAARHLYRVIYLFANWQEVWKYRRQKELLPPLRFRNGFVLNHGKLDNPLLLLNEVFVMEWYEVGAMPPDNATMVDIGANIGSVTLFWAAKSPSLRIYSYEPNPSAFDTLSRNVDASSLRNRVETFQEAVGRRTGELNLWVDVPTDLSTGYSDTSPSEGGRRITVPVIGLDEIWQRMNKGTIWLLKVDTEGAEVDILEGASESVLGAVQYAIIEYHDNIFPGAYKRCRQVLDTAGFQCRVLVHPWEEGIIYAWRGSKNSQSNG